MMDAADISPVRALRERMNLSFMDALFAWDLCPSDLQGLEDCWFDQIPHTALLRIARGTTSPGERKGFPSAAQSAWMRSLSAAYIAWAKGVFARRQAEFHSTLPRRKMGAA